MIYIFIFFILFSMINIKKFKFIGVLIIFLLAFISHIMYELFPNFIFSILFPVNESIWEHMKLIVTPVLFYAIFEYIILKKRQLNINYFWLSYIISCILGIIIYLVIYLPVNKIFGYIPIFAIVLLFITFNIIIIINYYINMILKINYGNKFFVLIIIFMYVLFGYLTYFPPNTGLFYDTNSNCYGINCD